MASARRRAVEVLVAQLGVLLVPVPPLLTIGLRHWERLSEGDYPAVMVELASQGGGEFLHHPGGEVRSDVPIFVYGVINTANTGAGRLQEREDFYERVYEALTAPAMTQALIADSQANGGLGVSGGLRHDGEPVVDEGMPPGTPYGVFRLTVLAPMHYRRGAI